MPHFKIVLTYRRRASVVFIYSFSKFPFCLPDVMGFTVVTFYVIDQLLLIGLVLNNEKKVITSFELVCPTFSNTVISHGIMYRQSLEIRKKIA